jgi:hypothetical protein
MRIKDILPSMMAKRPRRLAELTIDDARHLLVDILNSAALVLKM